MGFLAPWFLAGLAAVGLPVWLHLLKKHKTTPLPFSSLMFFERRTQSSVKHRRLMYLLLFALRTLLFILLALAFANPFINLPASRLDSGNRLLVVAVDRSFSMRQGDRLERAKREASAVLSGFSANGRAQALAFSSGVQMMSEATADVAAVRAGISAIKPDDARGSYAELSRALRSIAQGSKAPIEAHVFSDMQKSSLPPNFSDLGLADGVKLVLHSVAANRLPNFAVESVNSPRRVYGAKSRLQATVVNYGGDRSTRKVTLLLNGKEVAVRSVEVPASGRASAEIPPFDVPHGFTKGEVRIDSADQFPDDDRFYFSLERSEPRPILFVRESSSARDSLYFRAALESGSEAAFTLETVTPEQTVSLGASRYAFVVLSNVASLPQSFENALLAHVRSGGSLWISLGRNSATRKSVPVFGGAIGGTQYAARERESFQNVSWLDAAHPSIRKANRWDGVKFYQSIRVEPGNAKVAARLADGTPLLLEKQIGEGRVIVFASTFDNVANDFPLHASFVPFVEQTSRHLGRVEEGASSVAVGSFLDLRTAREPGAASGNTVEVLDPEGRRALSLAEAAKAQSFDLTAAGFYDIRRQSGRHELVAVNADRRESDLDLIPAETRALWQNTGQGSPAPNQAGGGASEEVEKKPNRFWWYVMLAVLALSVAETLVGNRHLAVDKEAA